MKKEKPTDQIGPKIKKILKWTRWRIVMVGIVFRLQIFTQSNINLI